MELKRAGIKANYHNYLLLSACLCWLLSYIYIYIIHSFTGAKKSLSEYGPNCTLSAGGDDEDEDDFELFGSDDEEEDDVAAAKLKEERIAAYTAKKDKSE